jgi:hypothetical protein
MSFCGWPAACNTYNFLFIFSCGAGAVRHHRVSGTFFPWTRIYGRQGTYSESTLYSDLHSKFTKTLIFENFIRQLSRSSQNAPLAWSQRGHVPTRWCPSRWSTHQDKRCLNCLILTSWRIIHTRAHTQTRTHTHTHMHTYTQTHTHTPRWLNGLLRTNWRIIPRRLTDSNWLHCAKYLPWP